MPSETIRCEPRVGWHFCGKNLLRKTKTKDEMVGEEEAKYWPNSQMTVLMKKFKRIVALTLEALSSNI